MRERWASLISGGGSTMKAIAEACQSGEVPMDVACVISSDPNAGGIEKAKKLIPKEDIVVVDPNSFIDKKGIWEVNQEAFGQTILNELKKRGVTVVTQNGWLHLTPENVIGEFPETIFNQHSAPVPEFGGRGMYGKRPHVARLLFVRETQRDYWTEAIAQRVHKKLDQGAVVKSQRVDILPDDIVDSLQQRVLPVEHQVQIGLLKDIARGNVKEFPPREPLVNPGEEQILFRAKKAARLLYPKG